MYEVKYEVITNITREFKTELDERNYPYSENAIDKIINEWMERKQNLLELLSKHPLWNPDKLMIQFDQDYSRKIELNELNKFGNWLLKNVTTWDDKTITDLNCTLKENSRRKNIIFWIIENIKDQFFNDSMKNQIEDINSYNENYKLRTNMKASKAIGKICREEGWDKLEGYNAKYAALCDGLNPIKVRRHTVISLNPIDFLLMSNGNSWCSCHYIGEDISDAGCYSSGTISYMLDECSFIFYTVDGSYDGEDIERVKKLQRQVFGYNDEVFLQSRLYPQANDYGAKAIYDDIRNIVQKVISDCLNKPNLWTISRNLDTINEVVEHGDNATCYPDWHKYNTGSEHCCLSTLKGRTNTYKKITLGAKPICISCGERHDYEENISCCKSNRYQCVECGAWIDKDDVCWVDGEPYCDECTIYCERCDSYERKENAEYIKGYWYCEDCVDRYARKCDCCGEYDFKEDMTFTEDGYCYCEDCASDEVFYCYECGECYRINEGIYDEETDEYYCQDCYEKLLKEREDEDNEQAV